MNNLLFCEPWKREILETEIKFKKTRQNLCLSFWTKVSKTGYSAIAAGLSGEREFDGWCCQGKAE